MPVIPFPKPPSQTRSRDAALRIFLPRLIGLIWDRGDFRFPDGSVALDELTIGGFPVGPGVFGVHVYTPEAKVFSAYLGDASCIVAARYWEGRCSILGWKRGPWEDKIARARVEPRSVAHVITSGRA